MSPVEQPTLPDSPKTTALSTPSSYGLGELYRTPVQTIIEHDEETEEDQITGTGRSTPDSIDIGIPHTPSDWLQPGSS
jgi:hypothetical protein